LKGKGKGKNGDEINGRWKMEYGRWKKKGGGKGGGK
jgi:hypothetical protein